MNAKSLGFGKPELISVETCKIATSIKRIALLLESAKEKKRQKKRRNPEQGRAKGRRKEEEGRRRKEEGGARGRKGRKKERMCLECGRLMQMFCSAASLVRV